MDRGPVSRCGSGPRCRFVFRGSSRPARSAFGTSCAGLPDRGSPRSRLKAVFPVPHPCPEVRSVTGIGSRPSAPSVFLPRAMPVCRVLPVLPAPDRPPGRPLFPALRFLQGQAMPHAGCPPLALFGAWVPCATSWCCGLPPPAAQSGFGLAPSRRRSFARAGKGFDLETEHLALIRQWLTIPSTPSGSCFPPGSFL